MPRRPMIQLVEDDPAMRDAILLLLGNAGLDAKGYPDAETFLADEENVQPTCLLVDVRLPGMSGIALHDHLVSVGADPATIVITGHGDIPLAVSALKAGAVDFVCKPFDPAALLDSVRDAMRRVEETIRRKTVTAEISERLRSLTAREASILDQLVAGHPNKVIAASLGISVRTVEHHRSHIMEKLAVRNLSHLIKIALGRID